MILRAQQAFDKVYLNGKYSSKFMEFIIDSIKLELINELMDKLEDHKACIIELKKPEFVEDSPIKEQSVIKQDLVCVKFVQCKNCRMVYPWCQKFRDELGGNGFCPYGREFKEEDE